MPELIKRVTPLIAWRFVEKIIPDINGCDCYEVYSEDDKIILCGNNNISLAMAYYRYLHDFCSVMLSSSDFDISNINKAPLPNRKITCSVKQKIRMFGSFDYYSAVQVSWGFDRWEKELDFLAMQGVNTPLCLVGSEAAWYYTLLKLGFKQDIALDYISGPSFWSKQLTGNLAGYMPLADEGYINRKGELGKNVTQRAKELGMNPVHLGMMPTVPFSSKKLFPKIDIYKAPRWLNFVPLFLVNPDDVFFSVFCENFLKKQAEIIGETHNYIFSPLYNCDIKGYKTYLEKVGREYSKVLLNYDSNAVWYINSTSAESQLINNAGDCLNVIVEDIKKCDSDFGNAKIIIGMSGNKSTHDSISGNINEILDFNYSEAGEKNKNIIGRSMLFDSTQANRIICAAAFKMLTDGSCVAMEDFSQEYAELYYQNKNCAPMIENLLKLCYNHKNDVGSVICARPCTKLKHTAPFDTLEPMYDNKKLFEILQSLTEVDGTKNKNYRYDCLMLMLQILDNYEFLLYTDSTNNFYNKDVRSFEKNSNKFLEIIEDSDRLLKTESTLNLFTNMSEAGSRGDTKELKQAIEMDFLMYHTFYGPVDNSWLYDANWCRWGGIVKDLYLKRWHMYFKTLAAYFEKPKKLKDNSKKQPLSRNEYAGSYLSKRYQQMEKDWVSNYIPRPELIGEEDSLSVVKELLEKYKLDILNYNEE